MALLSRQARSKTDYRDVLKHNYEDNQKLSKEKITDEYVQNLVTNIEKLKHNSQMNKEDKIIDAKKNDVKIKKKTGKTFDGV